MVPKPIFSLSPTNGNINIGPVTAPDRSHIPETYDQIYHKNNKIKKYKKQNTYVDNLIKQKLNENINIKQLLPESATSSFSNFKNENNEV